jgi:hypothetical protein
MTRWRCLQRPQTPSWTPSKPEAVALLALVAGQDVEPGERPGSWRIARRVAPDRVISTVDPQARHTRKTSAQRRDGYRVTSPPSLSLGWSPSAR